MTHKSRKTLSIRGAHGVVIGVVFALIPGNARDASAYSRHRHLHHAPQRSCWIAVRQGILRLRLVRFRQPLSEIRVTLGHRDQADRASKRAAHCRPEAQIGRCAWKIKVRIFGMRRVRCVIRRVRRGRPGQAVAAKVHQRMRRIEARRFPDPGSVGLPCYEKNLTHADVINRRRGNRAMTGIRPIRSGGQIVRENLVAKRT